MRETDAREQLTYMIALAEEPTLPTAQVDNLMRLARKIDRWGTMPDTYTYWRPATAYAVGTFVVPTTRNNHYYKVTTAGSSLSTEPNWTTTSGATVSDGATLVWTEQGATLWEETWNLAFAAAEGWRRKAALIANGYDFAVPGRIATGFSRSQIFDHCMQMSKWYGQGIISAKTFVRGDYVGTSLFPGSPFPGVESNWGFD